MGCTAKYDTNTFLEFFTYIAVNHEFAHNGAETFTLAQCASNKNKKEKEDIPASNTFLYHIVKFDVEELRKDFKEAFEEIFEMAKKGEVFKKRRLDIAVDLHDWLYYGDKNDPMVVRTKSKDGTTCCFRFATVNIVESGRRFTLLALPMGPFDNKDKILEELINYAKSKISIRNVYVDRGFFTVKCISALEELKVKWLMPAVRNKAIKKLMEKYDAPKVLDYVMGDKRYQHKHIEFRLVILNDKDGIKRVFATNLGVTEDNAGLLFQEYSNRCDDDLLFKEYGKRWGIETSYRVKKHEFRARTTSKKYVVRLFYFMFSTCLYNLWVLGNILISSAILKFVPKKPFITARTFGVTLCLDYLFSDP
jgi:putative transposase